jgi:hypothetical protein
MTDMASKFSIFWHLPCRIEEKEDERLLNQLTVSTETWFFWLQNFTTKLQRHVK